MNTTETVAIIYSSVSWKNQSVTRKNSRDIDLLYLI